MYQVFKEKLNKGVCIMGLAASQVRFLQMTAQKTNLEYKGQQINQSRTILANRTSNLFKEAQKMDIPTPPSKQDFTSTGYQTTLSDGQTLVIQSYTSYDLNGWENLWQNVSGWFSSDDTKANKHININKMTLNGEDSDIWSGKDLNAVVSVNGQIKAIEVKDSTGNTQYYSLEPIEIVDEAAYQRAMEKYEYDKIEYDKIQNEINKETEILQSQDKNLEIELKQIDTEHNALQTEIDAVKQVVQKNIESSFKTFS